MTKAAQHSQQTKIMRMNSDAWWDDARRHVPLTWEGRRCWVTREGLWWGKEGPNRFCAFYVYAASAFYPNQHAKILFKLDSDGKYTSQLITCVEGMKGLAAYVCEIFITHQPVNLLAAAQAPEHVRTHGPLHCGDLYFAMLKRGVADSALFRVAQLPDDENEYQTMVEVLGLDGLHALDKTFPIEFWRLVKIRKPRDVLRSEGKL